MRLVLPGEIATGIEGTRRILELQCCLRAARNAVTLDMGQIRWLDANMCALLGAVLHRAAHSGKQITVCGIPDGPRSIMQKNGFLRQFGWGSLKDRYGTTIAYRQFSPRDRRAFDSYIAKHFRCGARWLPPGVSETLLRRLRESLSEVFENAVEHSDTSLGIISCGQAYPNRGRLAFSIADLGIGIGGSYARRYGPATSDTRAIAWAMTGSNTTRQGPKPGGLGLKIIREFVEGNGGRLFVVSGCGYWEASGDVVRTGGFQSGFPGTAVTIEIRTDDPAMCQVVDVDPFDLW